MVFVDPTITEILKSHGPTTEAAESRETSSTIVILPVLHQITLIQLYVYTTYISVLTIQTDVSKSETITINLDIIHRDDNDDGDGHDEEEEQGKAGEGLCTIMFKVRFIIMGQCQIYLPPHGRQTAAFRSLERVRVFCLLF